MAEQEIRIFVRKYPEIFGWYSELEGKNPLVTVMVPEKDKNIPPSYFSETLKKDVRVVQEVSAPIIPY
ncbi:hypothetical protein LAU_0058 [Lausannevirus]|uniref:Uncharacterized protein n=2 Tax=Lausannevirus TaxID=999883 RepID=A0A0N7G2C6_9VIRU|nr:hypothetical protein LAU_0058 [Lausannevirus]AEA06914.1 hypothetical protein LAU_0058 [Lausannevirus]ALH06752.1 hypothetical protein PMV_054 [Port-miou virus]